MMGFPSGSPVKNPPTMQETWVQSLGWQDPLEKGTHSSILAWKNPMDRGAWLSTVHGVTKDLDMTQQLNNKNIGTRELNYIILSTFVYTSNFP